jgi:glycosyltransferase involved in cell wall biosynthesis
MFKVSIVIPTRNRSSFLAKAVHHAYQQNYENLEVIVSNNASTDNTFNTLVDLSRLYSNLVVINHENLLPLNLHWHKIISEYSNGELILLIPDDDVLTDSSYIKNVVEIFIKNNNIAIVFANYFVIDNLNKNKVAIDADFDEYISGKYLFDIYNKELFGIKGIGIPHLTAVFSKEKYLELGGFDLNCMSPDTYLWLKLILKYDVGFINRKVAEYLIHGNNLSMKNNIELVYSDTRIIPKIKQNIKLRGHYISRFNKTFLRLDYIFHERFYYRLLKLLNDKRNLKEFLFYFSKINLYYFFIFFINKVYGLKKYF